MRIRRSDIGLKQLLDIEELQSIQDNLASIIGISTIVTDQDMQKITEQSPPDVRFCSEVIKSTPEGCLACDRYDSKASERALRAAQSGKAPELYKCHAGLWDFVAPILIGNMLFGYLWCGRVRIAKDGDPELKRHEHEERAREYLIDPEEYMKALSAVPVFPREKMEASANVVYQVAMSIASQAYKKMTQQRQAERAFSNLSERTQELSILNKTAALVLRTGSTHGILYQVLEEVQKDMEADLICLYRYDRKYERFEDPIAVGELRCAEAMQGLTTKASIVWKVLLAKRPVFAENAQKTYSAGPFAKRERIKSSAAFPLRVQRHRVGVLFVNFRSEQIFPTARRQVLTALANQVALVMDYHRAVDERQAKADQLARLHTSTTTVLKGSKLYTVFRNIVKSVAAAFGFDGVALYLVEEDKNLIRGRYAEGLAKEWFKAAERSLDEKDILADIWRTGQTEVIAGFDPRFDKKTYEEHHHKDWVRVFAPVRGHDRIVGVLEAGYLLENKPKIEDEEVKALESFVHQVEIAVRNSRWLLESQALLKIAEILASERDERIILKAVISQILKVVPCSTCTVNLLGKKTGILKPVISQGIDARQMLRFQPEPGQGVTWGVFKSGEPRIFNNVASDPKKLLVPGTEERDKESLLVVPIRAGNQVLGTVNLNRYGVALFTEQDLEWLKTVANQVGTALERTELLNRYQQLVDSAGAIVQRLPLDQVLNEIVIKAAETSDAPIINIMLLTEDGELPIRASVPSDFRLPGNLRLGIGLSGFVADTREPYRTLDMGEDPHTEYPDYLKQSGHVSYLGVPMIHRDELVGVLNVHTKHTRRFTDDEMKVFRAFADLAAVAVSNARAFDQAEKEFELLAGAGATVSSTLGLDGVLSQLLQEGCALVGANRGFVGTVNESQELLVSRAWWSQEAKMSKPPDIKKGDCISGYVWETGKPYRTGDVSRDTHYRKVCDDVASEMAVPILAQDRVIGVLNASSAQREAFQQRHERLLVELANLSSIAIEKSDLLIALREVAEATVSEPKEFFKLLIAKTRGLVRAASVISIWLLDAPNKRIYHAGGEEKDPFADCPPLRLKDGISGKVIKQRKPIVVEDISKNTVYLYRGAAIEAGLRSLLSVPIMAADGPIGVLNVHTSEVHEFQPWEIDVLSAFAAQAGAAIEINTSFTKLRLLQEYAQSLSSAKNLTQAANCIAQHTQKAVGADITCLWLYDSSSERFHYGSSVGLLETEIKNALPRPNGMSKKILTTNEPIIIAEANLEPPGLVNDHAIKLGIRAIGGFPLFVGGRPMGVLYVDFSHPYYYTSDQIETVEAMAQLGAVAIDSARSVEARQQFLINVTHDLKAPLSAVDAQMQILNRFGYDEEVVRKIHCEVRRLTQLIESLLGLLRAEYAVKPMRPEEVDMEEMLDNMESMWSALVQTRKLTVSVNVSPKAKVVCSDRERVQCIVFNLFDNAVKFARTKVRLEVSRDDTSFAIVVEDDGPGMSQEELERFRLEYGETPDPYWDEMRSGVGYAAVRRFTSDMGGKVDIQCLYRKTRVIVSLPFLSVSKGDKL